MSFNSTAQEDKQLLNGYAVKPYISHGWGSWVPLQLCFGYRRGSTEGRSDEDGKWGNVDYCPVQFWLQLQLWKLWDLSVLTYWSYRIGALEDYRTKFCSVPWKFLFLKPMFSHFVHMVKLHNGSRFDHLVFLGVTGGTQDFPGSIRGFQRLWPLSVFVVSFL